MDESAVIGVLALQGDFAAHEEALRRLGVTARRIKGARDLEGPAGLVIPGGESTTLLKHFERCGLMQPLQRFAAGGGHFFGTCAGAIMLAREVLSPRQTSLGLVDMTVERNAYGRQKESFETSLEIAGLAGPPFRAVFIRAPRIKKTGPGVDVLASHQGDPVLVRQGRVLLATFHPEMTDDLRIHRLFMEGVTAGDKEPAPEIRIGRT